MSFDIYGNNLRGGHCEVHPHVHEEYPCSVCLAESASRHQSQPEPDYAAMQMESDLAQQGAYIKELTARIAELEAQLEAAVKAKQSESRRGDGNP